MEESDNMADYSHLTAEQLIQGIGETLEKLSDYTAHLRELAKTPLDPKGRRLLEESLAKRREQLKADLDDLDEAVNRQSAEQ
jgi:hypothetical protein